MQKKMSWLIPLLSLVTTMLWLAAFILNFHRRVRFSLTIVFFNAIVYLTAAVVKFRKYRQSIRNASENR